MYPRRNPITDENFDAAMASRRDAVRAMIADGTIIIERPYSPVVARNRRDDMARFMLENAPCTEEDLLTEFSPEEVTRLAADARQIARHRASRHVV